MMFVFFGLFGLLFFYALWRWLSWCDDNRQRTGV